MKALVIGGNGFVGSHLVDSLGEAGHDVRVFDRFSDGRSRFTYAHAERFVGDFMNVGDIKAAVQGVDCVFHFLSTTTPATAETDPLIDVRTNVTGSVELFRACAEAGVRHVYFASTGGAIYGDVSAHLVDETATPHPLSPYAIGKLTIEGYLRYFARVEGLASTSLRISNPYGPRQHQDRKQGVIPIFLRRVLLDQPLVVFGDGSMVRDYVYVADVARQITGLVGEPTRHSVYNIGSGQPHTLNDIIDVIKDVTNKPIRLEFRQAPATYVKRVVLDTARFRHEFGSHHHVTNLRDGVQATWQSLILEESERRP